ncbi:MAG: DUF1800 domain-containing protein [Methylovulum sp.]|nr:DUF1800 domain-containing protein [Methylovulum sp.]
MKCATPYRDFVAALWAGLLSIMLMPSASWADAPADCFDPLAAPVYPHTPDTEVLTPQNDAVRFLNMATFGATPNDIGHLRKMTLLQWVNEQFRMNASCHLDVLNQTQNNNDRANRMEVWFRHAVTAPDQLRQRVAFALSEIFVVSDVGSGIPANALAVYYDILVRNAFGNFRDILEQVTLSPAMGRYLSMLGNQKPNRAQGIRADENFAREVMQLFTIGLVQLNAAGVPLREGGETIPTYSQADIEGLARVFTGWSWGDSLSFFDGDDWRISMKAFPAYHDRKEKAILNKKRVPEGGTAEKDLAIVLKVLFNHPNVGPFIGRRLIQRLVTSNPSPQYIARVARRFDDNGQGVRGDMKSVIRAVLLDAEALGGTSVNPKFGKLREPLLVLTHLWRAFDGNAADGTLPYYYPDYTIGQAPLSAPSVFNFFRPDYAPSGAIKDNKMVAPEFQWVNDANNTRFYNELFGLTQWYYKGNPYVDRNNILIDINNLKSHAKSPDDLVNYLDFLLTGKKLPVDAKQALRNYLRGIAMGTGRDKGVRRSLEALYLIMSSPYYLIQR